MNGKKDVQQVNAFILPTHNPLLELQNDVEDVVVGNKAEVQGNIKEKWR